MMSNSPVSRALITLAVAMAFAACEKSEPETPVVDEEAARQNVEAMTREHAGDTTEPSEAALAEPRREIVAENLAYADVNDELVYGHFAFPADMIDPLPAIIVIHEWWGLNDNVRSMADQLAGEGYIVLAVDLFSGEVAETREQASGLMTAVVENPDAASENIRQAFSFLKSTAGAPRVASLGWCFGGGWSLNTAKLFPDELDAAVIYYGQVTDDEQALRPISTPILGHFGMEDRGIPVDDVRRFEQALERLRKDYSIHYYDGAGHAFANPTGQRYNAEAAEVAWQRTLEFLNQRLTAGSDEESS
jgi:carboxymethylenebutenolidase